MSTYSRKSLAAMNLTELRKMAKDDLSLTGLSKATRYTLISAIRRAQQARPMSNDRRVGIYANQCNVKDLRKLTPRQLRRIRKHDRKNGVTA